MWTRKELKNYAKGFLKGNYWAAFFAVLITLLLTGGTISSMNSTNTITYNIRDFNETLLTGDEYITPIDSDGSIYLSNFRATTTGKVLLTLGMGSLMVGAILMVLLIIMVGFVVEVGQSRFFLDGFKGDVDIQKLLSGFNSNEYWPIVKAQFKSRLYIFLWTFLFIIPGIVKSYSYRYVSYILAENLTLSSSEAISLSRQLTNGHKWSIFVLDLSFLGWRMLNLVTFGIASFFIAPYVEATNAKLYNVLSNKEDLEYEFVDFNQG